MSFIVFGFADVAIREQILRLSLTIVSLSGRVLAS